MNYQTYTLIINLLIGFCIIVAIILIYLIYSTKIIKDEKILKKLREDEYNELKKEIIGTK
jgi:hypothetical protein